MFRRVSTLGNTDYRRLPRTTPQEIIQNIPLIAVLLSGNPSGVCNIKHMWGRSVIKLVHLNVQSKLKSLAPNVAETEAHECLTV